jgi:hypothetical protein
MPKVVISAMGIKYDPNKLPTWINELTEHQILKNSIKKGGQALLKKYF